MTTTVSKKTIQEQAKLIQKNSKLNYSQSLHKASQNLGFKNYDHHKMMKNFKIGVYSKKGGVGKTPISRNLAIDLNSDCYFRVEQSIDGDICNQIFPKVKAFYNNMQNTNLSTVYDLCSYIKLDNIDHILQDIDIFIIPTRANECQGIFTHTIRSSIKAISKYNKPIIILSFGVHMRSRKKDIIILDNFIKTLDNSDNIYPFYMRGSPIYRDEYVYSKEIRMDFHINYKKSDLDSNAKSLIQIYNSSDKMKQKHKDIYAEYMQLLQLLETLITKRNHND
ncbi:MAG: hypothetical protein DRG78_04045 [Epsilonproteobacteria bacterium]|nr:MAG: hypothetical protein DRG78_04045 [Campylobacterota bacterium]